jgi:hypothetical protein
MPLTSCIIYFLLAEHLQDRHRYLFHLFYFGEHVVKTMDQTQKWDSIDSELARTYFNPADRRVSPMISSPQKTHHIFPLRRIIAIFSIFIAASLAFLIGTSIMSGEWSSLFSPSSKRHKKSVPAAHASPALALINERVLFDFEISRDGWEIPAWALDKEDHAQRSIDISSDISSRGGKSLRINSVFPPGKWNASLAEIQRYMDLSSYDTVSMDIYLPPDAPQRGFRAKLIFTVGEDWKFVEMSRSARLYPGKWTEITASLKPDSKDWKWTKVDRSFKEDVRKISLRVEYEGPLPYSGPIYVDNFRVGNIE